MNSEIFLEWFQSVFIPGADKYRPIGYNGPLFLILDGHTSHTSYEVIKAARDNNVELIRLPSHSTHMLQPLDLSVFGPLKTYWSTLVKNFEEKKKRKVSL